VSEAHYHLKANALKQRAENRAVFNQGKISVFLKYKLEFLIKVYYKVFI